MGKIFLLTGAFAARSPALPEERPSETEMAAVARKLRAEGFVSWEELQPSDEQPYIEASAALRSDGQGYDLRVNPDSLEILARRVEAAGVI